MKKHGSSAETIAQHLELIASYPSRMKLMFGHTTYFVNDNMWTFVYDDGFVFRLPPDDITRQLETLEGTTRFSPNGHPMKEYLVITDPLACDPAILEEIATRSHIYTQSLPPKMKKSIKITSGIDPAAPATR